MKVWVKIEVRVDKRHPERCASGCPTYHPGGVYCPLYGVNLRERFDRKIYHLRCRQCLANQLRKI